MVAPTIPQQSRTKCIADAELQTHYIAARGVNVIRPIQNFVGTSVEGPVPIYKDSQPTINVVNSINPTSRIRHIATFASYSSEQKMIGNSEPIHVPTSLQHADVGTKNVGRIQRNRLHANMTRYQHYPPMDSEHFKLLADVGNYHADRPDILVDLTRIQY